jgi:hypothetical protein
MKYYDKITWEGKELRWLLGHLSDGGYVVHLLGYFDRSIRADGPVMVGAVVVQECASCQAELPPPIAPGLEWVVVEGREPRGTVVAGPFISEANPREAEREANRMASVKWHEWAARVGRNCAKCGYIPEYCTCPK